VSCIEASRWDAGTAYVVVDAHRLDDETPYLFKTSDFGRSWQALTAGLDPEVYLHVVREDSRREGMLFIGTERGVMLSRDGGASWQPLKLNLPTVAVVDLAVAGDDLVVATLGRSAWILDDLTPVREVTPELAAAPLQLFAPPPAVRWSYGPAPYGSRAGAASNPPQGAALTYSLAAEATAGLKLEVLDAEGRVVRTLSSVLEPPHAAPGHPDADPEADPKPELKTAAGLHRVAWDLRHQRPRWPEGARLDTCGPPPGPLALPGDYTLRLSAGAHSVSRPLRVEADPRSGATPEALAAQLEFNLEQRDRFSRIAARVEEIRALRGQLAERHAALAGRPEAAALVARGEALAAALAAVEGRLHNPQAEVCYDVLAGRDGGSMLASRLAWLIGGADEHDGPPTQGMREVAAELAAELAAQEEVLARLLGEDLGALEALAEEAGVGYLVRP
jgi:hypothetical protein